MEWHQRCTDLVTAQGNERAVATEDGLRFFLFFERVGGGSDDKIPRLIGAEGKSHTEVLGNLHMAFAAHGDYAPNLIWATDPRWASARRSGDRTNEPSAEPTPTA